MTRLDFSQPPFDILSPAERQSLKKHSQVRYLAKGDHLTEQDLTYFYVVLKGSVQQRLADDYIGAFSASDTSNDWFDARRQVVDSDLIKLYGDDADTMSATTLANGNGKQFFLLTSDIS